MLSLAILLPIAAGLLLLLVRPKSKGLRCALVEGATCATSLVLAYCLLRPERSVVFLPMGEMRTILAVDGVGSVFVAILAILWPLAALYAFEYMEHEGGENHFFALYTMTYGVTVGIATAANLVVMYIFYEFLTLSTISLVMHGSSKEAVRAGHQYMMVSFFGAALAFVGVMIAVAYGNGAFFAMGGAFSAEFASAHPVMLQIAYLCMFVGFGVKAAIFPLHAWLPTASVAPTPVTALLHAVAVVKAGAFAIIRTTYFVCGAQLLRGTASQSIALALAAITIVFGSAMAVREHHFKRRLAYSTVSNLSYIILAATFMTRSALVASLTHMLFHAFMKITLFYCAGAILVRTQREQIEDLRGFGRVMPFTCAVYLVAALSLMGTPPLPGFVSKWLIGTAAIEAGSVMGYVGVAAILISAVLTAIYTMSVAFFMFFHPPREGGVVREGARLDPGMRMKLPLAVLTICILAFGLCSNSIVSRLAELAAGVL